MLQHFRRIVWLALAVSFLCGSILAATAASQELEKTPIILRTVSQLSGDLLTGPNYTVKPSMMSDGFVNTYDLDTSYGPLRVESTTLLLKRIGELKVLAQIEQLKGSDVYLQAARQVAAAPIRTAEGLIQDPSAAVQGVTSGIGRFFSRVSSAASSDNPYQGSAVNSALGQAAYKRQYAAQFGVDPYTSYEPLQKALDDLAWKAAAGALTVKAAFMAIPGGAGLAVGMSGTADTVASLTRDKTPAELAANNQNSLSAMGVPDPVAQSFLQNPIFDPYEQTHLVTALAAMPGVADRGIYIQRAAAADEEPLAVFLRKRAQLTQLYNARIMSIQRFVDAGGMPVFQTTKGKVVALFPLDYVAWTAGFAQKAKALSEVVKSIPGVTGKEFLITGTLSNTARKALEAKGWKVEGQIERRLSGS